MSYYDVEPDTDDGKLGKAIYMRALADRRGFRDDQLGIEDESIWAEIFEDVGKEARAALASEGKTP